jgi:cyclic-di-GMP-binding protein
MADEFSFDVVSKLDRQEVTNAVSQAKKEIAQRFDFKGSKTDITEEKESIVVVTDDDFRWKQVKEILEAKMVKRGIDIQALDYGTAQPAAGGTIRIEIKLKSGIPSDQAKAIVKAIKDRKMKVQAAIQGDQVRVTGKKKDELQEVMKVLRGEDFGLPLQFVNYR